MLITLRGGIQMEVRYANHPDEIRRYNTDELREKFLVEKLFEPGKVHLTIHMWTE